MKERTYSVSACIVSFNNMPKIVETIDSVVNSNVNIELYISDNKSHDELLNYIKNNYKDTLTIENDANIGFGAAHNKVLNCIKSDYHIVINPDVKFNSNVVGELCDYLELNPDVAMVSPKVLYPNGNEQHLPKTEPKLKYILAGRLTFMQKTRDKYTLKNENFTSPKEVDFCTGCFFIIRTEVFKKLNGFDERYFMYFEDVDLTMRAKKFGKTMFYPNTHITHHWERSSKTKIKYLLIHTLSAFKFFIRKRKIKGASFK